MSKFNLENYLPEIRAVGLDKFIVNLAVMKEQNPNVAKTLSRSPRATKAV